MSNWVKFSDRLPTEADAGPEGEVFVQHSGGMFTADIYCSDLFEDCYWLANVPPLPKPRTLEDVVQQYLDTSQPQPRVDLLNEMKEIIRKKLYGS